MGWISRIFGDKDAANEVISGAVAGVDKIFFTQEEKAEANQKLSEWYLKYLHATQPQNVARRLIAFIVAGLWAFLIVLGVIVRYFSDEYAQYIFEVLAEIVMNPFLMIMGFYFLTHAVRAYTNNQS